MYCFKLKIIKKLRFYNYIIVYPALMHQSKLLNFTNYFLKMFEYWIFSIGQCIGSSKEKLKETNFISEILISIKMS